MRIDDVVSCVGCDVSCQQSHPWTTMTSTRRPVLTRVIVTRRRLAPVPARAPVQVQGRASRRYVDWKKPSSAAHQTSSGTATNSVSPTTNWPPTSTTSRSRRRELHPNCVVFSRSKSSRREPCVTARLTSVCYAGLAIRD